MPDVRVAMRMSDVHVTMSTIPLRMQCPCVPTCTLHMTHQSCSSQDPPLLVSHYHIGFRQRHPYWDIILLTPQRIVGWITADGMSQEISTQISSRLNIANLHNGPNCYGSVRSAPAPAQCGRALHHNPPQPIALVQHYILIDANDQ